MSWTSPFTVASTTRALAAGVGLLHVRLEVGDRGLHRLGRLQHERQLHLAAAEQLADDLHAVEQHVVDDRRARASVASCSSRSASRPSRSPSMMRCFSRSLDRPAGAVLLLDRAGLDALEQRHELGERVVVVAPPVVDEVERDLALRRSSIRCSGMMRAACTIAASSPASRHSCRNTLLSTWRAAGLSPNDTFDRPRMVDAPGQLGLDAADRLDGLHARRGAGRRRRSTSGNVSVSKIRSVGSMPYRSIGEVVDALGDAQLPVGGAGLALLVDA